MSLQILLDTGLRISEAVGLDCDDVIEGFLRVRDGPLYRARPVDRLRSRWARLFVWQTAEAGADGRRPGPWAEAGAVAPLSVPWSRYQPRR